MLSVTFIEVKNILFCSCAEVTLGFIQLNMVLCCPQAHLFNPEYLSFGEDFTQGSMILFLICHNQMLTGALQQQTPELEYFYTSV